MRRSRVRVTSLAPKCGLFETGRIFVWGGRSLERKYYEAYDDRYRQIHQVNLKWFADTPSPIVGEIIHSYGITGKMLEIGCGEGRDAQFLLRNGFDLLATDVSPEAIGFCRKAFPDYSERFQVLDCITGSLQERFDFIYAVAVLHMLVEREDREGFYRFIRIHLKAQGYALICTMGDGEMEHSSDISSAFALEERIHEPSGKSIRIASTSYRAVSFDTFEKELRDNGLSVVQMGLTDIEPDYWKMMYAVVMRR